MFRRKASKLPADIAFPTTLEELGYHLNDTDQVRQIKKPDQKYQYRANKSERVTDMYREAMNTCVKNIVKARLNDRGFDVLRLPLGAGPTENHVPIYLSPNIREKKRIIVLFPERQIDPTILSYRVSGEEDIEEGSVIKLVKGILTGPTATDNEYPGLIITNPGQLYWCRNEQRAVTAYEWLNLPRPSAAHQPYRVDPVKNRIPGNTNSKEHVEYVFENVLAGDIIRKDAKLDLIGLEYTGMDAIEYLGQNWHKWSHRVSSICFGSPQHDIEELEAPVEFIDFISRKCRAYFKSGGPQGKIVEGRPKFGCNCYSSGEEVYEDQILIYAWGHILDHFNAVHTLEDYAEVERYTAKDLEAPKTEGQDWAS